MEKGLAKTSGVAALGAYPEFLKMWAGNVVSRLGDSVDSIALMWIVYKITGSGVLMGAIMAVNFLPNLALGPFAGVLVDRWNKKRVMLVCDLGRGAVVSLACVLFFTGGIRLWHLFVFTALNSTFESFATPARTAVIPRLVTSKAHLLSANGLFRGASSLAEMVGLGLGGAIVGRFGAAPAMAVDALTFFICAFCVAVTAIPGITQECGTGSQLAGADAGPQALVGDFRDGLRASFGTQSIRLCIMLGVALHLFFAPFGVIAPIYADKTLNAGAGGYAAMETAMSAAVMAGSLAIAQVAARFNHKTLLVSGAFGLGAGFLGVAAARSVVPAVLGSMLIGLASAVLGSTISAIVMETCPIDMLGRVSSVMDSGMMAAMPVRSVVAGFALGFASPVSLLWVAGAAITVCAIVLARFPTPFVVN